MPGMLRHEQSDAKVSCGAGTYRGRHQARHSRVRHHRPERQKRLAAYRVAVDEAANSHD